MLFIVLNACILGNGEIGNCYGIGIYVRMDERIEEPKLVGLILIFNINLLISHCEEATLMKKIQTFHKLFLRTNIILQNELLI